MNIWIIVIVAVIIYALLVLFYWALCAVAGNADRHIELMHDEARRKAKKQ
jgi:uncharacterized protein HemY